MTDRKIIKKAAKKAMDNGWTPPAGSLELTIDRYGVESIIFSHSFAKAFWGDEFNEISVVPDFYDYYHTGGCEKINCPKVDKDWKFHLQQIVLKKKPLKYIEKFL